MVDQCILQCSNLWNLLEATMNGLWNTKTARISRCEIEVVYCTWRSTWDDLRLPNIQELRLSLCRNDGDIMASKGHTETQFAIFALDQRNFQATSFLNWRSPLSKKNAVFLRWTFHEVPRLRRRFLWSRMDKGVLMKGRLLTLTKWLTARLILL